MGQQSNEWLKITRAEKDEIDSIAERLGMRGKMDLEPVIRSTEEIIRSIRREGDQALIALTAQYDHVVLQPSQLRVTEQEISLAMEEVDLELLDTIRQAADNIYRFHEAQRTHSITQKTKHGGLLQLQSRPLDIAGVYVPGGTAPLPSSVLMNILPAKAAGVKKIVMCTPPGRDGKVNSVILAAASIAGADEVYRVGGAQAIAAMAFGTETIPRVDKVTGPGNIYVNTAKRLVFGQVDIDMFAGPSEILIIADQGADPSFIAVDMLSQAEHDKLASAVLITDSSELAVSVAAEVNRRAQIMPRHEILQASLSTYGAILVVPDIAAAVEFANILAPEHLELMVQDPELLIPEIRNAGAVFVGSYSPEALGDYWAGPNHVLPTSGTARFFSPLSTSEFYKKMSIIRYTEADLAESWQAIARFADAESLSAHAESARVRFGQDKYR